MPISPDQAKQDVERVLATFETVGEGSKQDRAAQLVLQTIDVLSRRLNNAAVLKLVYLDNSEASKLLPKTVLETANALAKGEIEASTAEVALKEARAAYVQAFKDMGITPTMSDALRF